MVQLLWEQALEMAAVEGSSTMFPLHLSLIILMLEEGRK